MRQVRASACRLNVARFERYIAGDFKFPRSKGLINWILHWLEFNGYALLGPVGAKRPYKKRYSEGGRGGWQGRVAGEDGREGWQGGWQGRVAGRVAGKGGRRVAGRVAGRTNFWSKFFFTFLMCFLLPHGLSACQCVLNTIPQKCNICKIDLKQATPSGKINNFSVPDESLMIFMRSQLRQKKTISFSEMIWNDFGLNNQICSQFF